MDMNTAERIVNEMATQRFKTVDAVLDEFVKYQKNGKCTHFWPVENIACSHLVDRRDAK
jgi:hypothetical protein